MSRNFTTLLRWLSTFAAAAFLVATATTAARAQLIAADSFNAADYDPFALGDFRLDQTGPLSDGNPVVTPGWVDDGDGDPAPWNQGTGNLQWDTDAANPSLRSAGVAYDDDSTGKATFTGVPAGGFNVTFRAGQRPLDDYTPADTYYMSMFVNSGGLLNDGSGTKEHVLVGLTNPGWDEAGVTNDPGATLNPFGLMVGFHGENADSNPAAAGQVDLVIRARQNDISNPILTDTVLVAGTSEADISNITFHVMMKLEINVDEGATDRVTYWVDPSNVASEATATASAAATGVIDTLAMNTTSDIDRLRVVISSWENRRFFFDEVRLAYDFESLRGELPTSGLDGDYNNDGLVDAVDYAVWRENLGASVELPNDTTPGTVTSEDFTVWQANYGAAPPASAVATPEPAAIVLVSFVLGCVSSRGRRQ